MEVLLAMSLYRKIASSLMHLYKDSNSAIHRLLIQTEIYRCMVNRRHLCSRMSNEDKGAAPIRDGYKTSFEQNLTYGTPDDAQGDFQPISFEAAFSEYRTYMHAVHGMIYSIGERLLWNRYRQPGDILMQTRCDGMIGFPGGLMDHDYEEPPVDSLNRELQEEINLDLEKYKFVQSDYSLSNINHRKKLVTHFYTHEVTPSQFSDIEHRALKAKDWAIETFGCTRVPLFAMEDGFRGLPVFLANRFAGNARSQLIHGIVTCHLLSPDECDNYVKRYQELIKLPR